MGRMVLVLAFVFGCNRSDALGTPDAAQSLDGGVCDPPPGHPDGGACSSPPNYNPQVFTIQFWVADANAPAGGWRITLDVNQSQLVGGHTYKNSGGGLFGTGGNGLYGDVMVDVDGQANQLQFHLEGCVTSTGASTWDLAGALTRMSASCPSCTPATIARHYTLVRAGQGTAVTYTYSADEPPRTCGAGIDLLEVVLHGF